LITTVRAEQMKPRKQHKWAHYHITVRIQARISKTNYKELEQAVASRTTDCKTQNNESIMNHRKKNATDWLTKWRLQMHCLSKRSWNALSIWSHISHSPSFNGADVTMGYD